MKKHEQGSEMSDDAMDNKTETIKQILSMVLVVQCLVIALLTFMTLWNVFI